MNKKELLKWTGIILLGCLVLAGLHDLQKELQPLAEWTGLKDMLFVILGTIGFGLFFWWTTL